MRALMEALTDLQFRLAKSGPQEGRDIRSQDVGSSRKIRPRNGYAMPLLLTDAITFSLMLRRVANWALVRLRFRMVLCWNLYSHALMIWRS
jgi:hypothetical protein